MRRLPWVVSLFSLNSLRFPRNSHSMHRAPDRFWGAVGAHLACLAKEFHARVCVCVYKRLTHVYVSQISFSLAATPRDQIELLPLDDKLEWLRLSLEVCSYLSAVAMRQSWHTSAQTRPLT